MFRPKNTTILSSQSAIEFAECINGLESAIRYRQAALNRNEMAILEGKSEIYFIIRDDLENVYGLDTEEAIKKAIDEFSHALQTVKKMMANEHISTDEHKSLLEIDRIGNFDVIRNYSHVSEFKLARKG